MPWTNNFFLVESDLSAVKAAVLASAVPLIMSTEASVLNVNVGDTEEDHTEEEASSSSTSQPGQERDTVGRTSSLNPGLPTDPVADLVAKALRADSEAGTGSIVG